MATSKQFKHLSLEERELMMKYRSEGKSYRVVGILLCRSHTTIIREIEKNSPPQNNYYLPHKAHERAKTRKTEAHRKKRLKNDFIRQNVEKKLELGWSPEQISGWLNKIHHQRIGYEAIYQYIYTEKQELIRFLPRQHKKRFFKGHSRKHSKSHIPHRTSIDERPLVVASRTRFGDWEADTAVSRQSKSAIQVLAERKSRVIRITKLSRKTATKMKNATIRKLSELPARLRKTITYDNGSENTAHQEVNAALGTKSYFCFPFHSWEKPLVENSIGLIRRYFPKKTDFSKVSYNEIRRVENLLNNRPRKCLHYATPNEIFSGAIAHGM